MAAATFLGEGEPWRDITTHLRKPRKSPAVCAISYIGPNAPSHLPLRAGDVLVCNASDRALSSGATSPAALLEYLACGVVVYNDKALHAKVIVVGNNTWVGSANASDNSARSLAEAAVRTTDPDVRTAARKFIKDRQIQTLSEAAVQEMREKAPKKPRVSGTEPFEPQPKEPLHLPSSGTHLWMVGVEDELWTREVTEAYEADLPAERARASRSSNRARVEALHVEGPHSFKVGDWLCIYYYDVDDVDDHACTPVQLFDITTREDTTLLWTFKPPGCRSRVRLGRIEKALPPADFTESSEWNIKLPPKAAATVFDLFRRPEN